MTRFAIGFVLAAAMLCVSSSSAQAQYYQQYPNGAVVYVLPQAHYHYQPYRAANYRAPRNHFGVVYPQLPVYGTLTVQRTQLDPMRHFFNGNGSSYSHGTSQTWSRTRTGF